MNDSKVVTFFFKDDGVIPNNPNLPVVLYPNAFECKASRAEHIFNQHNWLNSWSNGVYEYHHYHSNAHEVLGIRRGAASMIIGGESGKVIEVKAGDVIVLPAGTGHKKLASSPDFSVAGAYPAGMRYNLKTGKDGERPQVLHEIQLVPLPTQDPVYGGNGLLMALWTL
ncbi:cupin domain-containing protein [Paenibacillus abyssi]|uniref:Cupin type-1 domain-containing protein n=1 Tax=Paenibacillus abyssi TaxID=1340531 RepID=A0A917FWI0_9BACL|nr:cupin domain-containing protein [Paenibacillus abyssi]GGG08360.1 hypothetical protein GCM10010916_26590 [Paenibacillus abyssi]